MDQGSFHKTNQFCLVEECVNQCENSSSRLFKRHASQLEVFWKYHVIQRECSTSTITYTPGLLHWPKQDPVAVNGSIVFCSLSQYLLYSIEYETILGNERTELIPLHLHVFIFRREWVHIRCTPNDFPICSF